MSKLARLMKSVPKNAIGTVITKRNIGTAIVIATLTTRTTTVIRVVTILTTMAIGIS